MSSPPEDYFVRIEETLVGRKPGVSAAGKARELRTGHTVRTLTERMLRVKSDEWAWRAGARGERWAARFLNHLPQGWQVFHDVPIGQRGANVDHVVIGPGGVFTVNTKNVRGKVWLAPHTLMVDGHRRDYLRQVTNEADRAARLLTAAVGRRVPVMGVLAIFADDWDIKEKPTDVYVGSPRGVTKWLRSLPMQLTVREVIELAAAASKPTTWTARTGRPTTRRSRMT